MSGELDLHTGNHYRLKKQALACAISLVVPRYLTIYMLALGNLLKPKLVCVEVRTPNFTRRNRTPVPRSLSKKRSHIPTIAFEPSSGDAENPNSARRKTPHRLQRGEKYRRNVAQHHSAVVVPSRVTEIFIGARSL